MTVNKKPLLIILGPTAVGKTKVSIEIAKKLSGEIISADSMQIYKYMDIGTAKIKKIEMENIPHYMIDIVYPDEKFTVANYKTTATKYIEDIHNRGKLPIIVGGTGFYINSLIYKLDFIKVPPNFNLRKEYENLVNKYGNEYLFTKLKEVDPKSAKRIHQNDTKRVIRALEVFHETGKPMSHYYKGFRRPNNKYNLIIIGLNRERKELYSRVNKRVDLMIEEGLIDEVKMLLEMGYNKDLNSMKGIGYKEIIKYLEGELSLEEAIELLKRNTRRYAKRQLTWFRRNKKIRWININEATDAISVRNDILTYVNNIF